MNSSSHFYKDKPLFGLDIGSSSIKVMQLTPGVKPRTYSVCGYGSGEFDPTTVTDGVITDFRGIAGSAKDLFKNGIIGEINTRRVAVSIPARRTFTREMTLPVIPESELMHAVSLEAEQYIPVPIEDLYVDYSIVDRTDKELHLLVVAAPRKVVDSYIALTEILGLEPVAFDATILSAGRLFQRQIDTNDIPTVLIDFGAGSIDITIHDKEVVVTGTVPGGGQEFTEVISKKLSVSVEEAHIIKTKYGLSKSKKQSEITDAISPHLDTLVKEIRRMIRYHEERSSSKLKVEQAITMGGGANMPGLSDYLTNALRLPVRMCNPWQNLNLHKLHPPDQLEKSLYVTVAGLALIQPKELFK